jgi:Apea-like HEPN
MGIRDTARAFVAGAFDALRKEFVLPTPVFHPYVHVGRDYFGDTIHGVPAYHELEQQLDALYPERFAEPLTRRHPEFASTYIFNFLGAAIAACGRLSHYDGQDHFDANSAAVSESIEELIAVLDSPTYEVVCCRFVSHLTTGDDTEITLGDITVVPEPEGFGKLTKRIAREIAGGWSAFNREDPRPSDKPHALLVIRERTDDAEPYEVAQRLSNQLERFLLLARLFSASTVYSNFEVRGMTTLVSRMNPYLSDFRGSRTLVRRTVWLTAHDAAAFEAIGALVDKADVKRDGMAATSFDVALAKFNASHHQENPYETLVDLATALEAILAGGEKDSEGLTLRLRNRTAALLTTDRDPATAIFGDVGLLYGLRSRLVHAGQIKQSDLRRDLAKISTMPEGEASDHFGVAIAYAVDRMRDLVRRAILARLCLAADPDPPWPFTGSTGVDALLSDDEIRARWRKLWRRKLATLGIEAAAGPPTAAVDFLTPHEQEDKARREPESDGETAADEA